MTLAENPAYVKVWEWGSYSFFTDFNVTDLHASRYVEALRYLEYANCGITPDILGQLMDEIIQRCNMTLEMKTRTTDIAALAQNVKYRLAHPVDQHCAIRIGSLMSYMEYEHEGKIIAENPQKAESFWFEKKQRLAMEVPEVYSFFIELGMANLPTYKELWPTLSDTDYFLRRDHILSSLLPETHMQGPVTSSTDSSKTA